MQYVEKGTHVMTAASVMNWLPALLSFRSFSILMATFFPSYSPNHTSARGRRKREGMGKEEKGDEKEERDGWERK